MNKQRAWDLYCKTGDGWRMFPCFKHVPEITKEERNEVIELWKTMPGNTCFADALARMSEILSN